MVDQAQKLRELVWEKKGQARVIAITSGKGGVGKTSTSVNLAIALAESGAKVAVLDADLGLANVEVLLGIGSMYNLGHVIDGEKSLTEILVKTIGGIYVVPGSSGLARVADLSDAERDNVLSGLKELQQEMDYIVIDTMAGIGQNAVAFAAAADQILLVSTPEPSSIVDAYAMLKTLFTVRDDVVVRLIVNMASSQAQAQTVANKLTAVSQQYLQRNLSYLGFIPRDQHVAQAVMQSRPFTLLYPNAPVTKCVRLLANRLMHQQRSEEKNREGFLKRFARNFGLASNG